MELKTGIKGRLEWEVTYERTAIAIGSGGLEVFSTPSLIAMMEGASLLSVKPFLDDGLDTVGTSISVRHLSATPVGMQVRAESELTEVDGRRLVFSVRAYDEAGLIGEGTHERFIISAKKFMAKTEAKKRA